jgi:hypothetical protein
MIRLMKRLLSPVFEQKSCQSCGHGTQKGPIR